MQTQLRKDKTMKNSNNNTYMFKGNETIKSVNDASFMFGKYVCRELEAIGMRLLRPPRYEAADGAGTA